MLIVILGFTAAIATNITCRPLRKRLRLTGMINSHQQVALQGTFPPQPQSRPRKYWRVWSTVSVSIQTDEDAI